MKTRVLPAAFTLVLAATAVAGTITKPVITVDGVAAATHLAPAAKAAMAQKIVELNTQLEKFRDSQNPEDLKAIHEECLALHNEIAAQLDPEQRQAFAAYLHAQMEAAGIDVSKFHGHHEHHS